MDSKKIIFYDKMKTDCLVDGILVFKFIQHDTNGKSGSNPQWGDIYEVQDGQLIYKSRGLYKEYDYDAPNAAYSEKIFSIIGKKVLPETRVPNIEIVHESKEQDGIISYIILDNALEDMIHIKDIMFNEFTREEMIQKVNIFKLDEIIQCVDEQVENKENFEQIKSNIIHVLLLDAITNNGDRHPTNWALIRNKTNNDYQLAAYDHASAFVDMFSDKHICTSNGWTTSYVRTDDSRIIDKYSGDLGEKLIKNISSKYFDDLKTFSVRFSNALPEILQQIDELNISQIDNKRLKMKLLNRNKYLKDLIERKEQTIDG